AHRMFPTGAIRDVRSISPSRDNRFDRLLKPSGLDADWIGWEPIAACLPPCQVFISPIPPSSAGKQARDDGHFRDAHVFMDDKTSFPGFFIWRYMHSAQRGFGRVEKVKSLLGQFRLIVFSIAHLGA